jgi:uncharacterized protein DUF1207
VNLRFEAAELRLARDLGSFRVYGGAEYLYRHEPTDWQPGVLHAGLEYRYARAALRFGRLGAGRVIAAPDAKSSEERKWRVGAVRNLSVQLQARSGPAPYGQFYQENVRSVGMGFHLSL